MRACSCCVINIVSVRQWPRLADVDVAVAVVYLDLQAFLKEEEISTSISEKSSFC